MATIANPNVDDVIVMKHHSDKLAVVTKVEGTTMKVKFMKSNGDVTEQHPVTIDSDKWHPISDEDKKCIRNEGGTELTGTIQDFDTDDLQFTIKWENGTETYCDFNKFVSARDANKKSTTGDKRPRTVVEEGEEVREWLTSIKLGKWADELIELGYDDLEYLQKSVDPKKLLAHCHRIQMKEAHIDKLFHALEEFRELTALASETSSVGGEALTLTASATALDKMQATVALSAAGSSVSLADVGKTAASSTPSVASQSLASSAPSSSPKYNCDLTKVRVHESMRESMNPCVNP